MDTGGPTTTTGVGRPDVEKLCHACAEACRVDRSLIEKISPASEEQIHRMEHHIKTGSYMIQLVMHYEGVLDCNFLLQVLNGIRFKNHILRTRLVKYEGLVYQVILKDSLIFRQVEASIEAFLARDSQIRMDYGDPLLRYAFIRNPHGDSFFVWSVHCCAFDNQTLCMIFGDLQTACSDLATYCKLPPRPPYGRYTPLPQVDGYANEQHFWLKNHSAFDILKDEFPVLGQGGIVSLSTMRLKKLLHLPKVESAEFDLATIGHAAWALAVASIQKQDYGPPQRVTVSFISITSGRRSDKKGVKDTMGPMSVRVPIWIPLIPTYSIEDVMRHINDEFASMIGFEHSALKILHPHGGLHNLRPQAVFSWHAPGGDLSFRRIICNDEAVAPPAVLAYREDLSVPYAHDYGLLFEVYEHDGHVAICPSWDDHLVPSDFASRLLLEFECFLMLVITSSSLTLGQVLFGNTARRVEKKTG